MEPRGQELLGGVHAARAAGVSYRKLEYWVRTGLFVPQRGEPHPGSGCRRLFTAADIEALRVLDALMGLRDTVHDRVRQRISAVGRQVQAQGARGRFELIPGITVDLKKLVAARPEVTT